jgi:catechol 2,3-dioxygenase-like lactoylglutathione lyase family enzyme
VEKMRLEHIAINTAEPVKMAQWYVEHLAMKIARSEAKSPFAHFLVDSSDQSVIEIYSNPAAEVPVYTDMSPFTLHFAFLVDDMAGERARLIAAGATSAGEPVTTPAGDQLAFLRDPWGVTLQLVKRQVSLL